MHRFPPTNSQMQPRAPGNAPYPGQDAPSSQPYPGYPPPHDPNRSNSNSPYVHPQGIPIPTGPPPPPSDNKGPPGGPPPTTDSPPASGRPTRKRKLQSPAPDPSQQQQHQLPPPPMPGQQPQYDPYYPPPPHQPVDSQGNPVQPQPPGTGGDGSPQSGGNAAGGRQLSTSKRAEQNRKAQRAFRERRDAHVKALESRSQLLDAALASADEANRRWEECRALVDQLRVENAALRAALGAAAAHAQGAPVPVPPPESAQKGQENGATHQGSRAASVERDGDD